MDVPNFPVVDPIQATFAGDPDGDAFVSVLKPSGSALKFSTYLGGTGNDFGLNMNASASGNEIWLAGATTSTDFPTVNALQSSNHGGFDIFLAKIALNPLGALPDLTITKTHSGDFLQGSQPFSYTITVSNIGSATTSGTVTVTDTLPSGFTATGMSGTGWNCNTVTVTCTNTSPLIAGTSYPPITLTVAVAASVSGVVTNTATVSGGGESNTANDSATDPTFVRLNAAVPALEVRALAGLAGLLIAIAALRLRS